MPPQSNRFRLKITLVFLRYVNLVKLLSKPSGFFCFLFFFLTCIANTVSTLYGSYYAGRRKYTSLNCLLGWCYSIMYGLATYLSSFLVRLFGKRMQTFSYKKIKIWGSSVTKLITLKLPKRTTELNILTKKKRYICEVRDGGNSFTMWHKWNHPTVHFIFCNSFVSYTSRRRGGGGE